MLRLAAGFPDALVRIAPDAGGARRLRRDDRPEPVRQTLVAAGAVDAALMVATLVPSEMFEIATAPTSGAAVFGTQQAIENVTPLAVVML